MFFLKFNIDCLFLVCLFQEQYPHQKNEEFSLEAVKNRFNEHRRSLMNRHDVLLKLLKKFNFFVENKF